MGDASWSAEANTLNFDMSAVYFNFVRSMADAQALGCGPYQPGVTPDYCVDNKPGLGALLEGESDMGLRPACYLCCSSVIGGAQRFGCDGTNWTNVTGSIPGVVPFDLVSGWPEDPAWGQAIITVPWSLWHRNGDLQTARTFYPAMKARHIPPNADDN
jgi:hypothetical protein